MDPVTFEVRPLRLTAVQEIGRAIHPVLARGQIEGGSAQGLGYALCERVVMKDGRMANGQLTNYIIPTTLDTPAVRRRPAGAPLPARALRRQGGGRAAHRRAGGGGGQRPPPRRLRRARDPRHARRDLVTCASR